MQTIFSNGSEVQFNLITPTTETADPYQSPQACDPNGTEEWVSSNGVPVGHTTEYPTDIKSRLETIPDLPTTAGDYKLVVTVMGGVPSYSWATIT